MNATVKDHIELRPEYGDSDGLAPGLIVTFDYGGDIELLPDLDDLVRLTTPFGEARAARVSELKQLGSACGVVFSNLTKRDAPLGTTLEWADARVGPRRVDGLGRVRVIYKPAASGS